MKNAIGIVLGLLVLLWASSFVVHFVRGVVMLGVKVAILVAIVALIVHLVGGRQRV